MPHSIPDPLSGRTAIVTGAGRGCGSAAARALASRGAKVCVSDINPDRADKVAAEITAAGGEAFGWQADIANRFQVASLIETTRDRYGRLDILVQHAHISPRAAALTMDEWEWRRTLEVNLTGAFFCMQLAGRVMADEGGGLIIQLVRPSAGSAMAAYTASRAGLLALAGALAAEWAASGVRVVAVDAESEQDTAGRIIELCAG